MVLKSALPVNSALSESFCAVKPMETTAGTGSPDVDTDAGATKIAHGFILTPLSKSSFEILRHSGAVSLNIAPGSESSATAILLL